MARILISIPDDFLAEVDACAERERRSRSELIREALRRYMGNPPEGKRAPSAHVAEPEALEALQAIQQMRRDVQPPAAPAEEWLRKFRSGDE